MYNFNDIFQNFREIAFQTNHDCYSFGILFRREGIQDISWLWTIECFVQKIDIIESYSESTIRAGVPAWLRLMTWRAWRVSQVETRNQSDWGWNNWILGAIANNSGLPRVRIASWDRTQISWPMLVVQCLCFQAKGNTQHKDKEWITTVCSRTVIATKTDKICRSREQESYYSRAGEKLS
jgi:hypothetical protein